MSAGALAEVGQPTTQTGVAPTALVRPWGYLSAAGNTTGPATSRNKTLGGTPGGAAGTGYPGLVAQEGAFWKLIHSEGHCDNQAWIGVLSTALTSGVSISSLTLNGTSAYAAGVWLNGGTIANNTQITVTLATITPGSTSSQTFRTTGTTSDGATTVNLSGSPTPLANFPAGSIVTIGGGNGAGLGLPESNFAGRLMDPSLAVSQWGGPTSTPATDGQIYNRRVSPLGVRTVTYHNGQASDQNFFGINPNNGAFASEASMVEKAYPLAIALANGGTLHTAINGTDTVTTVVIDVLRVGFTGVGGSSSAAFPFTALHSIGSASSKPAALTTTTYSTDTSNYVAWLRLDDEIIGIPGSASVGVTGGSNTGSGTGGQVTITGAIRGMWGTSKAAHSAATPAMVPVYCASGTTYNTSTFDGSPSTSILGRPIRYCYAMDQYLSLSNAQKRAGEVIAKLTAMCAEEYVAYPAYPQDLTSSQWGSFSASQPATAGNSAENSIWDFQGCGTMYFDISGLGLGNWAVSDGDNTNGPQGLWGTATTLTGASGVWSKEQARQLGYQDALNWSIKKPNEVRAFLSSVGYDMTKVRLVCNNTNYPGFNPGSTTNTYKAILNDLLTISAAWDFCSLESFVNDLGGSNTGKAYGQIDQWLSLAARGAKVYPWTKTTVSGLPDAQWRTFLYALYLLGWEVGNENQILQAYWTPYSTIPEPACFYSLGAAKTYPRSMAACADNTTPNATQPALNISTITTTANLQIVITTTAAHGLSNGQLVTLAGISANLNNGVVLNNEWPVTVQNTTAFLIPVVGDGTAVSGGTVTPAAVIHRRQFTDGEVMLNASVAASVTVPFSAFQAFSYDLTQSPPALIAGPVTLAPLQALIVGYGWPKGGRTPSTPPPNDRQLPALDQLAVPTGPVEFGGQQAKGLAAGTQAGDALTWDQLPPLAAFIPGSPNTTQSTGLVFAGLATNISPNTAPLLYTPVKTGILEVTISGYAISSTAIAAITVVGKYGACRTDAATITNASDSVTDTAIQSTDQGRALAAGGGIPTGTYVGTVSAGASFLLSSSPTSQINVNANANGTAVTLLGYGGPPTAGAAGLSTTGLGTAFDQGSMSLRGSAISSGSYFQCVLTTTGKNGCASPLTVGTQYWFDLGFDTGTGADVANLQNLTASIRESN